MKSQKWFKLLVVLLLASVLIIGAVQKFDTIHAKKIVVTGSGGFELGNSSGSFDLNGKEMTLDGDDDSSITCDTDDQCEWELGGADEYVLTAAVFDIGEGTLTRIDLDGDNDTSFRSSEDDEINLEIGGSDAYTMTATNFYFNGNVLTLDSDIDTTVDPSADDIITVTLGAATGHVDIVTGNLKVGDGTPTFTQDGEDLYVEGTLESAADVIMGAQTTFSVVQGVPITPTGMYQPLTSSPVSPDLTSDIAAGTTIGEMLVLHNINATRIITVDGTGGTVECKANISLAAQDTLMLFWNGADWVCLSSFDNS